MTGVYKLQKSFLRPLSICKTENSVKILARASIFFLKQQKHQNDRLNFQGEIFAYGGFGSMQNTTLLRFIKERFKRLVVTVDRDSFSKVKSTFESLGLKESK